MNDESKSGFEVTGFRGRECEEIVVRAGDRFISILSNNEYGQHRFSYHQIVKWDYPHHEVTITDTEREHLVNWLKENMGERISVDYRRYCSRCNEPLPGSDNPHWDGGECAFCGVRVDQSGKRVDC